MVLDAAILAGDPPSWSRMFSVSGSIVRGMRVPATMVTLPRLHRVSTFLSVGRYGGYTVTGQLLL